MSTYSQPFCASFKPSVLEKGQTRRQSVKAKLKTASGEPLMTCYGWYLEALGGKVDVNAGLVYFYLAAPAMATDIP